MRQRMSGGGSGPVVMQLEAEVTAMKKWIDGNQRRIQAIERENAEYERRLSLRNSRMSRGSLDDRRRSQSSLLDAPLGMLGDTTQHAKTEVEPRNTMAFIKT